MIELRKPTPHFFAEVGISLVLFMVIFGYQVTHFGGRVTSAGAESAGGSAIAQAFYFGGFGMALLAVNPIRNLGRLFLLPISLTVALAWCWLSLTWALAPALGLRRIMMVTMLAWTVCACVQALGYERSLTILRRFFAAAIALSLVMIFAFPDMAQQSTNGIVLIDGAKGWRGISIDKNGFGSLAAFSTLIFVAENRVGHPAYRWLFALLSFVCLIGSLSKTALGVTLGVLPVAFMLSRFPSKARALVIPGLMIFLTFLFLARDDLIRPFSEARYDPDAFTGRGLIWNSLWPYFQTNPYLGTGFGSFWSIGYESPIFTYARHEWISKIAQGHNGFLDLLVTVGIPGMILAVMAVFTVPIGRMLVSSQYHPNVKFVAFAVLLYAFGNNFTESTLLSRDTLANILTLYVVGLLSIRPNLTLGHVLPFADDRRVFTGLGPPPGPQARPPVRDPSEAEASLSPSEAPVAKVRRANPG